MSTPIENNTEGLRNILQQVNELPEGSIPGNAILYTEQTLTEEQKAQARENIGAAQAEEGKTFSVSGEFVEFDPEPETPLEVISHFQKGGNFYLHLYHINGRNLLDIPTILGGAGTVRESNGITATVNDDGTATLRGATTTSYGTPFDVTVDGNTVAYYRFPPGTYTTYNANGVEVSVYVRERNADDSDIKTGNKSGTFTVENWFAVTKVRIVVGLNKTVDAIVPLVLVRGTSLPEKDFLFSGEVYRATVYQRINGPGVINWSTGEVRDDAGNFVETVEVPNRIALAGTNYMWCDYAQTEVSGQEMGSGAIMFSPQTLTKSQQEQARDNIGAAAKTDYEYTNMLTGKKWYACGDSFTASVSEKFSGGMYDGKNKVYPYYIGRRCGIDVTNLAVGGQTMAAVAGLNNCFSEGIYQNVGADADYITIRLGINDDNNSVAIGTIDDATNTTFYGAWNVVMEQLIANHPFAHIGIIVPNGADLDYVEAVKAIAVKWGVPYLDFATGEQVPLLHRTQRSNVCQTAKTLRHNAFIVGNGDTHPNAKAHEYESYCIENWLMSL